MREWSIKIEKIRIVECEWRTLKLANIFCDCEASALECMSLVVLRLVVGE